MKRISILGPLAALTFLVGAVGWAQSVDTAGVLASTSWTAALARAAGAEDVAVLAPMDLTHPPEYELRPSDILRVARADLVVYAGYEVMVPRLLEAAENSEARTIRVATGYTPQILRDSIGAIATAIGTTEAADAALARLDVEFSRWEREVRRLGLRGRPVVAHFHQQGTARALGMNVVGVFGPAPLEARQLAELTGLGPVLVIDNGHNPVGTGLVETSGAAYTVWYNFPGFDNTETLLDVMEANREALAAIGRL